MAKFNLQDEVRITRTGQIFVVTDRWYDDREDTWYYMLGNRHTCDCNKCYERFDNITLRSEKDIEAV